MIEVFSGITDIDIFFITYGVLIAGLWTAIWKLENRL
jgi:hypothetical protein